MDGITLCHIHPYSLSLMILFLCVCVCVHVFFVTATVSSLGRLLTRPLRQGICKNESLDSIQISCFPWVAPCEAFFITGPPRSIFYIILHVHISYLYSRVVGAKIHFRPHKRIQKDESVIVVIVRYREHVLVVRGSAENSIGLHN